MAYGLAVLGLLGHLRLLPGLVWVALMLVLGARDLPAAGRLAARLCRRAVAALDCGRLTLLAGCAVGVILLACILLGTGVSGTSPLYIAGAAALVLAGIALWRPRHGLAWILLAWCLLTFGAALAPPADLDWDGLAEHLAQAAVYARTGHYAPLWYDHHSHFPALVQMLYALGLLLDGAALAKLFHWAFGLLALGAVGAIADHFLGRGSGKWAALVWATTPLVGGLMQIGYVDLATTAYGLLALLAFLHWRRAASPRALAVAALMAAGAMATKMQGIPLFGILLAGVLATAVTRRWPAGRSLRHAALFCAVVLVIAGPWYAKSWLTTGNPVYPFAYGVFGGKHWGPAEARQYDYHQKEFGVDHLPPPDTFYALPRLQRTFTGPRSPLNLLLAPWNLSFSPVPFTETWRQGNRALRSALLVNWIGPLYFLGLLGLVALRLTRPPGTPTPGWRNCTAILLLFLPLWLWWLASMQFARYLIPSLALLAPCAGLACHLAARRWIQALPLLWAAAALTATCLVVAPPLACVSGMVPADTYLRATCEVYEPSMALNQVMPPTGKAILYGEPRGFYIARDYMWGDPGHHRIIPYERLKTPTALVAHLRSMGITHALINQAFAGAFTPGDSPAGLLAQATQQGLIHVVTDPPLKRREYVILDLRSR
jgi:4-amino-4-deoxy-L-arabinose transferase-like glycosyltransferase